MTANRVDQASLGGALANHERRLRVLEAVPPCCGAPGLPPWQTYTPGVQLDSAGSPPISEPAVTVNYAWIMVQTVDGGEVTPAGSSDPLTNGTVLGNLDIDLVDPGSTIHDGVFGIEVTTESGLYFPESGLYRRALGSGYILQAATNTFFAAQLVTSGPPNSVSPFCRLLVPGVPDLTPPSASAQNLARIDWPWVWADGDKLYSGTFMYPAGHD